MHLAVTGSPRHLQTTKDHNFTIQLEITRMTSCLVTGISRDLCSFFPSHLLQICGYNSQLPRWNLLIHRIVLVYLHPMNICYGRGSQFPCWSWLMLKSEMSLLHNFPRAERTPENCRSSHTRISIYPSGGWTFKTSSLASLMLDFQIQSQTKVKK